MSSHPKPFHLRIEASPDVPHIAPEVLAELPCDVEADAFLIIQAHREEGDTIDFQMMVIGGKPFTGAAHLRLLAWLSLASSLCADHELPETIRELMTKIVEAFEPAVSFEGLADE